MPNTGPNPISKYISYDNFGWALLTSLQLVTMDYWESIYNSVSSCLFEIYVFCEISLGIVFVADTLNRCIPDAWAGCNTGYLSELAVLIVISNISNTRHCVS